MIFDGKPIDEIKDEEFDTLTQEGISEHQSLEYKETYNVKDSTGKLEILRDITSLANAGGGYLIVGIKDDGRGKAVGYRVHTEENLMKTKQQIQQLCLDHIAERIPRLEFRIRQPSGHHILVVQVPDSSQAPHMVKFDRRTDFYTRYDEGKREMSVAEIRRSFQQDRLQHTLDTLSHQVNKMASILHTIQSPPTETAPPTTESTPLFPSSFKSGDALVQARFEGMKKEVGVTPYFWIAATPNSLGQYELDVDSPQLRTTTENPLGSREAGWNMKLTALINNISDGVERGTKEFEYLALFTNVHMEFWTPLNEHFCWTQKKEEFEKKPELYPYPVVEYPVTFLRLYKAIVGLSNLQGEITINLRYANLRGYRLRPYAPRQVGYMFADEMKPYQHDHLILPSLRRSHSFDPDKTAYGLLKKVYSSFGLSSSTIPFYNEGQFRFPS